MPDYRKTTNIKRTLVGHKIVDHSDVVGASPVGTSQIQTIQRTLTLLLLVFIATQATVRGVSGNIQIQKPHEFPHCVLL